MKKVSIMLLFVLVVQLFSGMTAVLGDTAPKLEENFDLMQTTEIATARDQSKWQAIANAAAGAIETREGTDKYLKIDIHSFWNGSNCAFSPSMSTYAGQTITGANTVVTFDFMMEYGETVGGLIRLRTKAAKDLLVLAAQAVDGEKYQIQYKTGTGSTVKDVNFKDTLTMGTWYRLVMDLDTTTGKYDLYLADSAGNLMEKAENLSVRFASSAAAPVEFEYIVLQQFTKGSVCGIDNVYAANDPDYVFPTKGEGTPTPSPTASATVNPSPSESATPSAVVSPSPVASVTPSATSSASPSDDPDSTPGVKIIRPVSPSTSNFKFSPDFIDNWQKAKSNWVGSGTVLCDDNKTRSWYTEVGSAWVQYLPNFIPEEAGEYRVYIWGLPDSKPKVSVSAGGETIDIKDNNFDTENPGWILVGTYDFEGGSEEYVKIQKGTNWCVRASSVKFEKNEAAPVAKNVQLSGGITAGAQITAFYEYQDVNGDLEKGSTYTLYRADSKDAEQWDSVATGNCRGGQPIELTVPADAKGAYIKIGITPKNEAQNPVGVETFSSVVGPLSDKQEKPVASEVEITGNAEVDALLTATYRYSDANNDAESGSTYRWSMSSDAASENWTTITEGTCTQLIPQTLMLDISTRGKYIKFEILPKNTGENGNGDAAVSNIIGPIGESTVSGKAEKITFGGQIVDINGKRGQAVTQNIDSIYGAAINGKIEATYKYTHQNGIAEDKEKTQYQWYTTYYSEPTAADLIAIEGADDASYTVEETAGGKYLVLGIKAASADGKLGDECYSDPILVKWNLAFFDEFDYTAKDGNDPQFTAKWNSENGKRTEEYGRYPKNLEVKDGYVYCTVGKPDGTEPGYVDTMKYTAGSFSAYDRENDTAELFSYGYFEASYKYAPLTGLNNSFWLSTPGWINVPGGHEMDINEGHYPNKVNAQIHYLKNGKNTTAYGNRWNTGTLDLSEDFHTYGAYWTTDKLCWTFDNDFFGIYDNTLCQIPTTMLFSVAPISFAGEVTEGVYGQQTVVDYIRYFEPLKITKTDLERVLNESEALLKDAVAGTETGNYPQEAIDSLTTVRNAAKAVYDNPAASDEQIEKQYSALSAEIPAFRAKKVGDRTELSRLVQFADKLLANHPAGTGFLQSNATLYLSLQNYASEARLVIEKDYPIQSEIDEKAEPLNNMINSFCNSIVFIGTANSNQNIDLSYASKKAEIEIPAQYNPNIILPQKVAGDITITRHIRNSGSQQGFVKMTIPAGAELEGTYVLPNSGSTTMQDYEVIYSIAMAGLRVKNDKLIRLEFNNAKDSRIGMVENGTVTEITKTISSDSYEAASAAMGTEKAVKYQSGAQVVVYTKSLMDYVIYKDAGSVMPSPSPSPEDPGNHPGGGSYPGSGSNPGIGIIRPGGTGNTTSFTDIKGHWAEKEIKKLEDDGIVKGKTGKEFMPDDTITRAEFAALIVRSLDLNPIIYKGSFSDITGNEWFAKEIQAVADSGIMKGDTDGNFRPNDLITRQEMAKTLVNAYRLKTGTIDIPVVEIMFTDQEKIDSWALESVQQATAMGLLKGMDNGSFAPLNSATRAQSATVIYRLLQLS